MLCFVHIERAGGTTLHHILRNNSLGFLTLSSPVWTNVEANVFRPEELRGLLRLVPFATGFGGHHTRTYAGYEAVVREGLRYFTFLREPISRYVSHFNYQVFDLGRPWTIQSFLAEERLWNFVTRRLAGGDDLELAKRRLAEDFAFVGRADRFDESLVLLKRAMDWEHFDPRYEKQNASRDPSYEEKRRRLTGDPTFIEGARERNALDIALWEYALSEVFPRYRETFGDGLDVAVEELSRANERFRFSGARKVAWKAVRAAYAPVERRLRRRYHAAEPPAGPPPTS